LQSYFGGCVIKKSYSFFLVLFVFLAIFANFFKSNRLHIRSLDAAPTTNAATYETFESPTKPAEINTSFSSTTSTTTTKTSSTTKNSSSAILGAPIYNVSDMNYNGGALYSTYGIMHATAYPRFYYAHNTGAFATLSSFKVGTNFQMSGASYVVKNIAYYTYDETAAAMNSIVNANGTSDVALMTCAGTRNLSVNGSITNTHRLIVFADKI